MLAIKPIFDEVGIDPALSVHDALSDAEAAHVEDDQQDEILADQWIDTQHFTLEAPATLDPFLSEQVAMVLSLIEHLEFEGVAKEEIQRAWEAGGLDNHYEALVVLRELAQDYPHVSAQFDNGINQVFGLPQLAVGAESVVPNPATDVDYKLENKEKLQGPSFS